MRLGVTSRTETILLRRVANSPLAPAADSKQNNIYLNFKLSSTGIPLLYSILQTFRASYQTDLSKVSLVSHCKTRIIYRVFGQWLLRSTLTLDQQISVSK